jgi:hypothetical protein
MPILSPYVGVYNRCRESLEPILSSPFWGQPEPGLDPSRNLCVGCVSGGEEDREGAIEDLARIKAALGNLDRAEMLYRRALELRGSDDLAGAIPVHQRLAQVLRGEQK